MSGMDPRDEAEQRRIHTDGRDPSFHGSHAARARLTESGAALIRAQYRLWEHDLADPRQPMLDYGFQLFPDVTGVRGRICRFESSDGVVTIIRNNSIAHGHADRPAIELERATFHQHTVEIRDFTITHSPGVAPREAELLPHLLAWIGSYEQWIADRYGDGERHSLVGLAGNPTDHPSRWWDLASKWRAALVGAGGEKAR